MALAAAKLTSSPLAGEHAHFCYVRYQMLPILAQELFSPTHIFQEDEYEALDRIL
jgi:hypothetical protein